jgi:antitoxin (DNA-binding transcriptional repressor) of toxin-antitoxin stability system
MAMSWPWFVSRTRRWSPSKIAELGSRHYLRLVRRGEPILVCDRDRVIARIERVEEAAMPRSDADWLARLVRRGVIWRGTGRLRRGWVDQRPPLDADLVAALLRDRREGP